MFIFLFFLQSDLLVLSCDFISNYPLINFINFYRIHDPSLSILIANESSVPNQGQIPGRKTKVKTGIRKLDQIKLNFELNKKSTKIILNV